MKRAGDWQALHFGCGVLGSHTMHDIQVNSERFFEPVLPLHGRTTGGIVQGVSLQCAYISRQAHLPAQRSRSPETPRSPLSDDCLCRESLDSTNIFCGMLDAITAALPSRSPTRFALAVVSPRRHDQQPPCYHPQSSLAHTPPVATSLRWRPPPLSPASPRALPSRRPRQSELRPAHPTPALSTSPPAGLPHCFLSAAAARPRHHAHAASLSYR